MAIWEFARIFADEYRPDLWKTTLALWGFHPGLPDDDDRPWLAAWGRRWSIQYGAHVSL
ncbi:hypothetical protein ACLOJK_027175 [Asimina triloba]